jgi:hypothetical protein
MDIGVYRASVTGVDKRNDAATIAGVCRGVYVARIIGRNRGCTARVVDMDRGVYIASTIGLHMVVSITSVLYAWVGTSV